MIDVHCPDCGRILIGSRQIVALRGGDAGIEVAYVCWCGRPGAELIRRPARARRRARPVLARNEPHPAGVRG
jgi:hypothetical protein